MKINGLSAISLSRQIAEVCEYLFGHRNNSNIHVSAAQKYIWNNKINNPSNEGSNGDMLVTDGNGGRSWSALPTATKDNKGLVIGNYTAVDEYPLGIDADGMVCVPIADGEDGGIVKADGETLTCTDGEMSVNTDAIQPKLVSGTNIKTINNQSLLGSGNIVIQGGGGEVNVIEVVKRNGTPLEVTNKEVDVSVPTKTSDLTNDSGFLTQHQDISGKVDKVTGKGLSTNDYTDGEKESVGKLAFYDGGSSGSIHLGLIVNRTATTDMVHDLHSFISSNNRALFMSNGYGGYTTVMAHTSGSTAHLCFIYNNRLYYCTLNSDDTISVTDVLATKQNTLVSGTNIKTINNQSLLGGGNIVISGGGGVQSNWNETDTSSLAYIQNKPAIPYVPTFSIPIGSHQGYTLSEMIGYGFTTQVMNDIASGLITRCRMTDGGMYEVVMLSGNNYTDIYFGLFWDDRDPEGSYEKMRISATSGGTYEVIEDAR